MTSDQWTPNPLELILRGHRTSSLSSSKFALFKIQGGNSTDLSHYTKNFEFKYFMNTLGKTATYCHTPTSPSLFSNRPRRAPFLLAAGSFLQHALETSQACWSQQYYIPTLSRKVEFTRRTRATDLEISYRIAHPCHCPGWVVSSRHPHLLCSLSPLFPTQRVSTASSLTASAV